MKESILRVIGGGLLIGTGAFVAYTIYRRRTEGTPARMKAPFVSQLLPYPITSDTISGKFGELRKGTNGLSTPHSGLDIKTRFLTVDPVSLVGKDPDARGTPGIGMEIRAPFDGVVVSVYDNAAGGHQMIIKAKDGTNVGFAHLLVSSLDKGASFEAGDLLGAAGNSGPPGTPPHLHLTVHDPTGTAVDPAPYVGV